ncbi:hypothetical protein I79_008872 [Cricetulus griseus]|uniref:Uncharacterized protein n=1 Tax=Cricetulus griseus TaxID=10029 RepID=G3HE93_CRIGR|nr:hypothetical protein I79_008872 [Cricetulus griseus]
MTKGARVWHSSGVGHCLPFLTLPKPSLAECRLCQVSEKRRFPANIGYQFCLPFASQV